MISKKYIFSLTNLKYFLFLLYLVLFYFYGNDSSKLLYSEAILVILFIFEIIKIFKTKTFKFDLFFILYFALSTFCLLSSFWAIDSNLSVEKSITLYSLSILYFIGYNIFVNGDNCSEKVLKIIMYSGIIFAIYIIFYYGISNYFDKLFFGERIGTEINNVNKIGLTTSISFLISIFFAKFKSKNYLFFSVLLAIVTIGTGSRTALIEMFFSIIFIILIGKEKEKIISYIKKILIIITLCFLLFSFIQKISSFDLINRFTEMTNYVSKNGEIDGSTSTRMKFIQKGFETFTDHPLLGIGAGNAGYVTSIVSFGRYTYLHNNYVELLATTGLIGFLLYYSIHIYILIKCFFSKNKTVYSTLATVIIIILLIGDIGTVSYASKTTVIYFLYGSLAINRRNSNE